MRPALRLAGWLVVLSAAAATSLRAEDPPRRYSIWDIHLGDAASAIPNEYVNQACGTNGGPPSSPLPDFTAFRRCKPEASGLREVYFQYDDELEYEARALDNKPQIKMYAGTTVFEFPIVASVLFDDSGRVRGKRMVTDPRQQLTRDRLEFWELGNFVRQHFGEETWACDDLPPEEGESALGSRFIKNRCTKIESDVRLVLEQHFFQKKGQQLIDPATGKGQMKAFESSTRFEMIEVSGEANRK